MATPASLTMGSTEVLLLRSKSATENIKWSVTMLCAQICEVIKYVSEHIKSADTFVLIVEGNTVEELLNDPIYNFEQVRLIYAYYNNDNDLKRDKNHIKDKHGKLRFCHEQNLKTLIEKLKADNAVSSSIPNYRTTVNDVASSWEQRISAKRPNTAGRHSPEPKRFVSTSKHGFSVKNIKQIDSHCICSSCKFLFRDPHQLECGHRICQSCIKTENDQTTCLTCFQVSSNKSIWPDRGFRREIQQLSITCSGCDWTGSLELYPKHIDQKHPDGENSDTIMDVCSQQTDQSRLDEPVYMTEARQQVMSDILSSSRPIYMSNNSNVINDQYHILFTHFQEMICTLSNRVNIVINDQQRTDNEICRSQILLQIVDQNLLLLKASFEDVISRTRGLQNIQDLLAQQIWSLKQAVQDALFTSFDGTYIWKITGVREKIADAQSERQKSIYSPPFYSSPTGYKMCMRLYLNGDSDVRGRYLSLFFVLMQGDYDAILEWPFSYKVLFRLIDQSTPNDYQHKNTDSFWPDIRSNCFQRPVYNMNHAYGIKEFLSLAQFKQNQSLYVKDDTMFIEAKIDFLSKKSSISSTGGSPNDDEHVDTISENFMHMS